MTTEEIMRLSDAIFADLRARNEALTTERDAALDDARKVTARAEEAERRLSNLRASHDLPRVQDVARIDELEAECERRRARERELVAALALADQVMADTVTEERRLLEAECERLRAALRRVHGALCVLSRMVVLGVQHDHVRAATGCIDAALAGAPAEPSITREQVEREIALDADAEYSRRAAEHRRLDQYSEGWCDALDMFERRIRSGTYRKTSEATPAAAQVARSGTAADTPAPPSGVAEDRSEPPPCYRVWSDLDPPKYCGSWGAGADVGDNEHEYKAQAVAACWAHRDAVVADAGRTAAALRECIAELELEVELKQACIAGQDAALGDARKATDTRIERALVILRKRKSLAYERHVSAAIAVLEGKP